MGFQLSLKKDGEEVMKFLLTNESTSIGRATNNDICLPDPDISRTHVLLSSEGGKCVVTDKSTNGTFLNGEKISSRQLNIGDTLELGRWHIQLQSTEPSRESATDSIELVPTKISSYNPQAHELVFENACVILQSSAKSFPLQRKITTVGLALTNDICLTADFVSNFHCRIENRHDGYFIKDLQSTNGTYLNGQKVMEAQLTNHGLIEIGSIQLRFAIEEKPQTIEEHPAIEFEGILSNSPQMRRIFSLIEKVSQSDATVLIQGETGSGKELVAKALHVRSERSNYPYVTINCGSISKDLIESELFGHEKGAFTSAHQQRRGVFEQAHGGTLFLDEIGELPLDLQPKLLRVLENREIRRVGGSHSISVNVRVVAATHKDLVAQVSKGQFREDLFYRLFIIPIYLPPLRDRKEDIPLLVNYFSRSAVTPQAQAKPLRFSKDAIERLNQHVWPGNIRELKNVIQRAMLETDGGMINAGHITFAPMEVPAQTVFEHSLEHSREKPVPRTLKDMEKEKILTELKRHKWNKTQTAQVLGIAKSTLHEKIKKYDIQEPEDTGS